MGLRCLRLLQITRLPTGYHRLQRIASSAFNFGDPDSSAEVFDRDAKSSQRARMAFLTQTSGVDALHAETARRLVDKLQDVLKRFQKCLVLGGAGRAFLETFLADSSSSHICHVTYVDQCPEMVQHVQQAFSECRRVLQPDGLFLGSVFGGESLFQLRRACHTAEEERCGGVSQRFSPLMHVRDAGSLLSEAEFTLQTVDVDDITVQYNDVGECISHLRAAALYSCDANEGKMRSALESTFQLICMTGWAPDPRQPRAARRGSGTVTMKDIPTRKDSEKRRQSS